MNYEECFECDYFHQIQKDFNGNEFIHCRYYDYALKRRIEDGEVICPQEDNNE